MVRIEESKEEEVVKVDSRVKVKKPEKPKKEIEKWKRIAKEKEKDGLYLFKDTLKQLQADGIQLHHLASFDGNTLNLMWDQVIKIVNRRAREQGYGSEVLTWNHTLEEAMVLLEIFL